MNKTANKNGFTVIELLMAITAFSVLVLSVSIMLIFAWRSWTDFSHSVNMHRDATYALKVMAKEIRNSSISEITGDADSIDFSAGVVRSSSFSFRSADIPVSEGVVLTSWVEPVIGSNTVSVAFTLANMRGTDQNDYSMTIYPRN